MKQNCLFYGEYGCKSRLKKSYMKNVDICMSFPLELTQCVEDVHRVLASRGRSTYGIDLRCMSFMNIPRVLPVFARW